MLKLAQWRLMNENQSLDWFRCTSADLWLISLETERSASSWKTRGGAGVVVEVDVLSHSAIRSSCSLICGLGARNDDSQSNMIGDFRISRLLETQGNSPGRRYPVSNTIGFKKDLHSVCAHGFIVHAVTKHLRESRQCFGSQRGETAGNSCDSGKGSRDDTKPL